jgi:hypothetical protein
MDEGKWSWRGSIDMTASFTKPLFGPTGEQLVPVGVAVARDLKTSGKKWSKGTAETKCQPIHYSIGMKADPRFDHVDTGHFEYEIMTKTKTPDIQRQVVTITEARRQGYMREVAQVRREMQLAFETNTFRPNRSSFRCSKRLCGFWRQCEERWGPGVRD